MLIGNLYRKIVTTLPLASIIPTTPKMYKNSSFFISITLTFSLLVFCLIGFNSCQQSKPEPLVYSSTMYAAPNDLYRRDSMFIAKTVWEFIDKEVYVYDFVKKYHLPLERITINVDTIFYSADTLKMLALVIKKMPDLEEGDSNSYYYSGIDLKGFRTSTKEPWHIYPPYLCAPTAMPGYGMVRQALRYYFLKKFKSSQTYIWDSVQHDLVSVSYGYNIDEKDFWDSSVLWKKGALTPGYYIFQNKGNVMPDNPDPVWILPHLDYPDSLLKLYQ